MTDNLEQEFPLLSSTGKRYRTTVDPELGHTLRVYQSGLVWDEETKKAVKGSNNRITAASGREMANTRWEKHKKDFERGAIQGAGVTTAAQAREKLGEGLMRKALDEKAPQSVSAAEKVAVFSGWRQERPEDSAPPAGEFRFTMTGSIRALQESMRRKYQPDSAEEEKPTTNKLPAPYLNAIEGKFEDVTPKGE